VLGIECDGASYHSAKTARDRDRLREQVLTQLGWRIHRIWSQDWFERRDIALKRLRAAIDEAEQAISSEREVVGRMVHDDDTSDPGSIWAAAAAQASGALEAVGAPPPPPKRVLRDVIDATKGEFPDLPWVVPYRVEKVAPYSPGVRSGVDFHEEWLLRQHAERIAAVVNKEGPVHIEVLAHRLARAFGVQRVGSRISEAVDRAARLAERDGAVVRRGPFVWPRALKELTHVRIPTEDAETRRSVKEIPPEEVDLAILRIVEASTHIPADELRRVVARLFRFDRTGDIIAEYVDNRMEHLLTAGKLTRGNDGLSLAARLPPAPTKPSADGYRPGDRVIHPLWGTVTVVRVEGHVVTVDHQGRLRQVDASVAKLRPLVGGS
jgi:hypothetical protein